MGFFSIHNCDTKQHVFSSELTSTLNDCYQIQKMKTEFYSNKNKYKSIKEQLTSYILNLSYFSNPSSFFIPFYRINTSIVPTLWVKRIFDTKYIFLKY